MDGALGLKDVSEEDIDRKTGKKSPLKTGNLKRSNNMPKEACDKYTGAKKERCKKYIGEFAKYAKKKKVKSSASYG